MSAGVPRLFLCSILSLLSLCTTGKEYKYLNFSTKEGLAGDNIYSIMQDHEGFIWIATATGLSRFDGTTFRNYTVEDGLPCNDIITLWTDRRNRIWILPFKNEICYYYQGRIYNKQNTPLLKKLPALAEEKSIAEDSAGRIMIISRQQFVIINTDNTIEVYSEPYSGPPLFAPVGGYVVAPRHILPPSLLARGPYTHYAFTDKRQRGRNKFACLSRQIFVLDPNDKILFHQDNFWDKINTANPHSDSTLIMNTPDGTRIYNVYTRQTLHLLKGFPVNCTFIDRESGIWLGTRGMGLFYLPPSRNFSLSGQTPERPLQAYNFYGNKEHLIVGNSHSEFRFIDKASYALGSYIQPGEVTANMLYPLKGNLLKCSEKGIWKKMKLADSGIYTVKTLSLDGDSLVLAMIAGAFKAAQHGTGERKFWEGRATCAYSVDNFNYVGTLDGFFVFRNDGLLYSRQNSTPLIPGVIAGMAHSYKNNLIWVTTSDNGLFCLQNNKVIRHITTANGLSSNICTCIFTDGAKVFVGTGNGLNVINPEDQYSINCYYTIDGLCSDNINCVYVEGRKAWVGTPKGISILDLSATPGATACRLFLTGISASGRALPYNTTEVHLPPQATNIEIRYSGISFRSIGKIKYTYRIRNLNEHWQTTNETYLKFPILPAGKYDLEIFATNRYGVKSSTITIHITIDQYWWQHLWLQIAVFLFLLGLILLIAIRIVKRIRAREAEKAALKEKISDLEQMALQAQMNPHFIFNSLNSFYQYVINRDLKGASKFMNDFSTLIRLLFEIMAQKELSLDKEIRFLTTYLELEKIKLNHLFTYTINIEPGLPVEEIRIPTFIIQPFVENSIRHGIQNRKDRSGEIMISIFVHSGAVTIGISDNGVGRARTARIKDEGMVIHNSRGTSLTLERVALFNKMHDTHITINISDKYTDEGAAAGTVVTISIPIKQHHDTHTSNR